MIETPEAEGKAARWLLAAYLLAWLLLPVWLKAPVGMGELTPSSALPGSTLLTKAAAIPPVLLLISLFACREEWRRWRPDGLDLAVTLFCALPLLHDRPVDCAYLVCVWLTLWLLGRVLLADAAQRRDALALIAISGLLLLPVALLEGLQPAWLYGAIYGPHPFQTVGVGRYLGYRPLGFFEDGNQYGLWTAMAALAAIELARCSWRWRVVAAVLAVIAFAAQSAGAIVLLLVGAVALVWRPHVPRWLLPIGGAVALAGGALYLSGLVPIEHIARNTAAGQSVLGAFRAMGRGSLPWRISQDQRALPLIKQRPLMGHGTWDWWRPIGRRPWGLPMLVIGQYGLVGFALLALPLLAGAGAVLVRGIRDERLALAAIVLLAAVDALLNSTLFFPAILLAGALARSVMRDTAA